MTEQDIHYSTYAGPQTFLRLPILEKTDNPDIAVIGIPYDLGTSNRSGARFGPRSIREQSLLLSEYPEGIWPWNFHPTEKASIADYGDIAFEYGYPEDMVKQVDKEISRLLDRNIRTICLGGDHYVTYPVLKAYARKYDQLSLIHFDAHSDTWDMGGAHNHGTMFYHAAREGLVDPSRSVQLGLRTTNDQTHGFNIFDAMWLEEHSARETAQTIKDIVQDNPAYITFDIDFLDPAFAPGTGTPVAGGPSTAKARNILYHLQELNIVGGDQVEVSPPYDATGHIAAVAGSTLATDILYLVINSLAR